MASPKSHCSICQRDMQDANQLREHQGSRRHARRMVPPQPPKNKEKMFACAICGKKFWSKGASTMHENSGLHSPLCAPLNCLFSEKCKRKFSVPSAMLMHVESGQCISGWSREEINKKIIEMDVNRRISIPLSLQETTSIEEEDTDDGEDGWEIIRDESSWQRSWSFSSFESISAPSLISDACPSVSGVCLSSPKSPTDSKVQPGYQTTTQNPPSDLFSCPLCPESSFRAALDLAQHEASLVHSLPIFRLPASLSLSPYVPERRFTSLGGLAHHLESRGQRQDDSARKRLLDLVNEIISEFGFQGLWLSLRESR